MYVVFCQLFVNLIIHHLILIPAVKKESTHTIGVEFGSKIIEVGGRNVKLQIWYESKILFFYYNWLIDLCLGILLDKRDSGRF